MRFLFKLQIYKKKNKTKKGHEYGKLLKKVKRNFVTESNNIKTL